MYKGVSEENKNVGSSQDGGFPTKEFPEEKTLEKGIKGEGIIQAGPANRGNNNPYFGTGLGKKKKLIIARIHPEPCVCSVNCAKCSSLVKYLSELKEPSPSLNLSLGLHRPNDLAVDLATTGFFFLSCLGG